MASPADPAAADLADLYRRAQVRLEQVVRAALERDAQGTAAYYSKQLRVVERILADLRARTPAATAASTVRAYNAAALTVDRMLGAGRAFGGVHQVAVDVLAQAANTRLVDATTTVGRRTGDAFRRASLKETALGIIEGNTIEGVADALRDRLIREAVTDATTGFIDRAGRRWPLDAYARMVARTTTREAQSAATANRMIEHDQDIVQISDHGTTSEICLPYEGGTFSLTGATAGYPVLDALPPFHPNLVSPWTQVRWRGDLGAAWRVRYDGPLVHVTTKSGVRLAVGPHHPVMTSHGWLPAHDLREGDEIVRGLLGGGDAVGSDDDLNDMPATAEQIFDARSAARGAVTAIFPSTRHDFHGDGVFSEGQVDVVVTDGLLRNYREVSPDERGLQIGLMRSRAGAGVLARCGTSDDLSWVTRPVPASEDDAMLCQSGSHRRRADSSLDGQRLAAGSSQIFLGIGLDGRHLYGSGTPSHPLCGPGAATAFAARAHLHAALDEFCSNALVTRTRLTSEIIDRGPSQIPTDQIVAIEVRRYSGHAYDLSVADGHYTANGLAVSNCVHVLTPAAVTFDEWERELQAPA